jgi:hypothetical protein
MRFIVLDDSFTLSADEIGEGGFLTAVPAAWKTLPVEI